MLLTLVASAMIRQLFVIVIIIFSSCIVWNVKLLHVNSCGMSLTLMNQNKNCKKKKNKFKHAHFGLDVIFEGGRVVITENCVTLHNSLTNPIRRVATTKAVSA